MSSNLTASARYPSHGVFFRRFFPASHIHALRENAVRWHGFPAIGVRPELLQHCAGAHGLFVGLHIQTAAAFSFAVVLDQKAARAHALAIGLFHIHQFPHLHHACFAREAGLVHKKLRATRRSDWRPIG